MPEPPPLSEEERRGRRPLSLAEMMSGLPDTAFDGTTEDAEDIAEHPETWTPLNPKP